MFRGKTPTYLYGCEAWSGSTKCGLRLAIGRPGGIKSEKPRGNDPKDDVVTGRVRVQEDTPGGPASASAEGGHERRRRQGAGQGGRPWSEGRTPTLGAAGEVHDETLRPGTERTRAAS